MLSPNYSLLENSILVELGSLISLHSLTHTWENTFLECSKVCPQNLLLSDSPWEKNKQTS